MSTPTKEDTAQAPLRHAIHHLFNLPEAPNAWQRAVDHEKALAACLTQLALLYGRDLELDFADTKGEIPVALKEWQQRQGFGLALAAWLNQITVRKDQAASLENLTGQDNTCSIHHQELQTLFSRLYQNLDAPLPATVYVQDLSRTDTMTVPLDRLLAGKPALQFKEQWLAEPYLIYQVPLGSKNIREGELAFALLQTHYARIGPGMRERLDAVEADLTDRIAQREKFGAIRDLELEATLQSLKDLLAQIPRP